MLWPLSLLYGCYVSLRRFFYQKKWLSSYRSELPVISVGNIVAGGTGKTPFTLFLAKRFHKPAILIRGYKSALEHAACSTLVDHTSASAEMVGDEAALLAQKLPHAMVYVGKRRRLSAKMAIEAGANCLILDDGFQHLQIQRDLNILLIDCTNPFSNGFLLPLGMLRESLSAMSAADVIVLTRTQNNEAAIKKTIARYSKAPVISSELLFEGFYDLSGNKVDCMPSKAALFCGIGNPGQFLDFIEKQGVEVVLHSFLQDHEKIEKSALEKLYQEAGAKGATAVVTTEKDAIKLEKSDLPLFIARVSMKIVDQDEAQFNQIVNAALSARVSAV